MQYFSILLLVLFGVTVSAQNQTVGVSIYEENTAEGYIFFSPEYYSDAYLIDNCGFLINSWDRDQRPGLSGYLAESGLMLRANKVNGAHFSQPSTGGNLELVDWDNNTIWSANFNTEEYIQHHDAKLLDNGNIIFLGWERISPSEQTDYGRNINEISFPNLWGEFVWEIKPVGSSNYEIVWEWHLQDHFIQDYDISKDNFGVISDNKGRVNINYLGPGAWDDDDWWHCNAIDYNPEKNQILVNSRNNNETWIIDHSTTVEEAQGSTGGNSGKGGDLIFRWGNPQAYDRGSSSDLRMYGSHGQYWIPPGMPNAGKIMYFNNGDERPEGYYSTIEMIDPPFEDGVYLTDSSGKYLPDEPELVYKASSPFTFVSNYLSNAQQLANGNVFINEGGDGRLFEIDEDKQIVWQYISPVDNTGPQDQGEYINNNAIFRAYKYSPDYPAFDEVEFETGGLIEGDSEFNLCKNVGLEDSGLGLQFTLSYDLSSSLLSIEQNNLHDIEVRIISSNGELLLMRNFNTIEQTINLKDLQNGVYVVTIIDMDDNQIVTRKILKM